MAKAKHYLVQTRFERDDYQALKREAKRRRTSIAATLRQIVGGVLGAQDAALDARSSAQRGWISTGIPGVDRVLGGIVRGSDDGPRLQGGRVRTKAVSVRLDFEVIAAVDAAARCRGQTRSKALRQAVEEWVRERERDITSDAACEEPRRSA